MKTVETIERERRWLLCESNEEGARKVLQDLESILLLHKKVEIKQWYISTNPVVRLRSHDDKDYVLCVKTRGKNSGLGVPEKESELNQEEFDNLFKFVVKEPIVKTRYYIPLENGLTAELDVFRDILTGLIIIEVEFESDEEAASFIPPVWFGDKEITGNRGYANSTLYRFMPKLNSNKK